MEGSQNGDVVNVMLGYVKRLQITDGDEFSNPELNQSIDLGKQVNKSLRTSIDALVHSSGHLLYLIIDLVTESSKSHKNLHGGVSKIDFHPTEFLCLMWCLILIRMDTWRSLNG